MRRRRVLTDFLLGISNGDRGQFNFRQDGEAISNNLGGSGQDDTVTIVVITVQRSALHCSKMHCNALLQCLIAMHNVLQCIIAMHYRNA